MEKELRKSGISVVGDVPWGTHFCTFYETTQDLLDILVPFFKTGLENKEFCLWIISNSELLTIEEARNALRNVRLDLHSDISQGRIELVDHDRWFLDGEGFDIKRVAHRFEDKLNQALAKGYAGMRVNGSPAWLYKEDDKQLINFERRVDKLYPDLRIIASCTYPIPKSDVGVLLDVAEAHRFVITRRRGNWEILETPELMQAKQEIQRLNQELEQRVTERTKTLEDTTARLRAEIEERKDAEESLRESETKLKQAQQLANIGYWERDLIADRITWSKETGRIVGLESFRGVPSQALVREFIHPDDRQHHQQVLDEALQGSRIFDVEVRIVRPDGNIRFVHIRDEIVRDESGKPIRMFGAVQDITERKQAEEAVRASQQLVRLVLETLPVGVAVVNRAGDIVQVNAASKRIWGGTIVGGHERWEQTKGFWHDSGERIAQENWASVRALSKGETSLNELIDIETYDRRRKTIHNSVAPIRNEEGLIVGAVVVNEDITDRVQAEEALRRSEDHLRMVIDTIPTMAWSRRPDGAVDFVNQRWMDYTGLSLEEESKEPTRPIHPEDMPRAMERWHAQMAVGEGYEEELRLRRADGEYRWFLVRTEPLHDEQGNLVKWYGSSTDIEDRKQAEEKLRHSEVQLGQAQRLAHIGSWDWDLHTNAVTWSEELYHIFGLQPGTISAAEEVDRFIHPDDLDLGWDTVKRAFASKEPYDYYHRILRPDGTERIARSRGSIMSDERGEPISVFGATQDVTELKHAEEKLKATTEQLRALSASVQSAREEESKRIAREIHDELGGDLTRLRWDLEEVGEIISEATDSTHLSALRNKVDAMINLTDTTLDTVRRVASELRPMALDELGLVEATQWQARQFESRTGIAVDYECSLDKVDLNSHQSIAVFRILQEALTNILRHAQAEKVTITIRQKSGQFSLAIQDNGRGIRESEKSAAHSLGLLGMRERALLIGAAIDITGTKGKGTEVIVKLPISVSD